jgi:hypothetical protein
MFGGVYKCTLVWLEYLKERDYLEEIGSDGREI